MVAATILPRDDAYAALLYSSLALLEEKGKYASYSSSQVIMAPGLLSSHPKVTLWALKLVCCSGKVTLGIEADVLLCPFMSLLLLVEEASRMRS
jgi:hypothetical protein